MSCSHALTILHYLSLISQTSNKNHLQVAFDAQLVFREVGVEVAE